MASSTRIVKFRRKLKKAALGRKRKNLLRKLGSTRPNLKLDKPNANEVAQGKAMAARKAALAAIAGK